MPVHNGAAYLSDAVDSILRQSLRDFELLIVDDASTDESVAIIERYKDSRIRLLRSMARLRLSGALNLGLENARGDYVARMDADDISLPRRLEIQVRHMNRHPELGMCGSWIRYFGGPSRAVLKRPSGCEEIRAFTLVDTPFAHPTVMLRRSLMDRHHLRFDSSYYPTEDFELWTRTMRCFPVENLPQVLLRYRVHDQSLTGSDWSRMDEQAIRVIARQFQALGLETTPDTLRFHRELCMGRVNKSAETLSKADVWFEHVLAANDQTHFFDPDALSNVLGDVWFRVCMHAAHLGPWVAKRYADSNLVKGNKTKIRNRLIITLGAIKAMATRVAQVKKKSQG
jgi:glycosyltransferase involved in cell wall biosynthesis